MGLREDIKKTALEIKRVNKRDCLLGVAAEIELMIKEKIPLPKQIELLVKNNIVDSIDLKYYRNILKSDFGYGKKEPTKTIMRKQEVKTTNEKRKKEPNRTATKTATTKTATEMLSQSIELEY